MSAGAFAIAAAGLFVLCLIYGVLDRIAYHLGRLAYFAEAEDARRAKFDRELEGIR